MDFTRKIRVRTEKRNPSDDLELLYPHSCMMYYIPPTQDITLQMFEELAIERVKVLRILEQASSKNLRYQSDEWKESIIDELNLLKLKSYVRLILHGGATVSSAKRETDLIARQRDYISHFILRFVYARSEELRKWFITREMELFRLKFAGLSAIDITKYLEINKLMYTPLDECEISDIKAGLYESTIGNNLVIEKLDFYKVPFTDVLDLIRSRKCFVKNGFAYVSTNDFTSVVASKHEHCIRAGLDATHRILPEIETDERIFRLIKGLHTSYTGKDFTVASADNVAIECLDQLSKKSFPLCMRVCHETLRSKHHLKHGARMQYGLFLKGIGVTLEDSIRFWQEEFTKIMDYDKFQKSYTYNIRHNYGKEGSMTNYTPYSCLKIITDNVGPMDCHGCPFKTLDQSVLRAKLTGYGMATAHVQDVVGYAVKGHSQLACGKYFEITMETQQVEGISHPNQFFEMSQRVMNDRSKGSVGTGTPSQHRTQSKKGSADGDLVVMKVPKRGVTDAQAGAFDGGYDDELWNSVDVAESQLEQTQQLELMEDADFDVSQIPDDY